MRERRIQAKIRVAARACLSGEIGPIEGCYILWPITIQTTTAIAPEDKSFLGNIVDETSTLPVGRLKDDWHPHFVGPKLEELTRYETAVKEDVKGLCERLLTQFAKTEEETEQA